MLEVIRTFFGKLRGAKGARQTVIEQGTLWRCTKCHLIFLTKTAGEDHECKSKSVS
jgi:hypothetical protein